MENMEFKSFNADMEEKENGVKILRGYASVFGNVDSHGDVVQQGAFQKSIMKHTERPIRLFSSHSTDARDILGTVTVLKEDSRGLYFEADLSQAPSAQDILMKAKEGHLGEISIGFYLVESEFQKSTKDADPIRLIKEVDLVEISLVSIASNSEALVLEVKQEKSKEKDMSEEMKKENDQLKDLIAKMSEKLDSFMDQPKNEVTKDIEVEKKAAPQLSKKEMEEEAAAIFCDYLKGDINKKEYEKEIETKALNSVVFESGSGLIPERLYQQIIEKRERLNKLEQRVNKVNGSGPLNILDFDVTLTWASHADNATISETTALAGLGKSTLDPQDYALLFSIPNRLQRRSMQAIESLIANSAAKAYRELKDDKILQGTGANGQPLGIVTMLDDLSSTSNTVAVTTTADVTYSSLVDMVYLLNEEYRQGATFVASPEFMKCVRKLQGTSGMPIFQPVPIAPDAPPSLLGFPLIETRAFGTVGDSGSSLAILGDLSTYILLEEQGFSVEVDKSVDFKSNKTTMRMIVSFDGMPTDSNAFVRITTDS